MDDWSPVEAGAVPSTHDLLHYDCLLQTTVLTVQGSDDDADLWRQDDKENEFGSIVADTMFTNRHIQALRFCCNGTGSNSNGPGNSTSIIGMADATKVCLLSGLRHCGNRIRHLTLLSSLSSPPMSSGAGITDYSAYSRGRKGPSCTDDRPYGRDKKRHQDFFSARPFVVSSRDETETAWILPVTPQDVNHIMSASLLLSTTMWNCRNLKELVLELSTSSSGDNGCLCIDASDDANETWRQVAFSLQNHEHLEIVRVRIRSSTTSSSLHLNDHERERHERQEIEEEVMNNDAGPLDVLVTKGLVTLPRLRIFEQHGQGNAAAAAGNSAKLQASSLVDLMVKVPSLQVLRYSNLGFATDFASVITKDFLQKWQHKKRSLQELDLSDNSLTDHDVMAIAKLVQVQVWTALRKINLSKNPDINYCGQADISNAVQELKKKSAVKQISLELPKFSLYPSDDEEEDDDDGVHLDQSSTSPTTVMCAFSPLLCGGGGGRQEHESPPFPSFVWNDGTPPVASTSTSVSFHKYDNSNNNMNSNNDMMTD